MSSEIIHVPASRKAIEGTIVEEGWVIDLLDPDLPKTLRNIADLIERGNIHGNCSRYKMTNGLIDIHLIISVNPHG